MLIFLQHVFIDGFAFLTFVFSLLFLFGIVGKQPLYFQTLNFVMLVYIGMFMVYRFKIQTHIHLSALDKKVCYLGGTYILWFSLANIVTEYYNAYLKRYTDSLLKFVQN